MAKYRIIALAVSGAGKKVFRNGQIVDEKQFVEGAIPGLVKGGYIKKDEMTAKEKAAAKKAADKAAAEAKKVAEAVAKSEDETREKYAAKEAEKEASKGKDSK